MLRTLLLGLVAGGLVTAACAGLLTQTDALPLQDKVLVSGVSGAAMAVIVWVVRFVRAVFSKVSSALSRYRAHRSRRKELAIARQYRSAPNFEENDETVLMTGRRSVGRLDRTQVISLLEQARGATSQGHFESAAELFSDVIDGAPAHLEAHLSRGRIFLDLGDFNRAMSDFFAAEDLAPLSPEPPIAMGDLYFARKDYPKAIEYYDAAIRLAPEHAMALTRRGMSHYYRKNYPVALEDLERAHAIDPDIPNLATHLDLTKKKVAESASPQSNKRTKGKRR